jgi:hypothetical protein
LDLSAFLNNQLEKKCNSKKFHLEESENHCPAIFSRLILEHTLAREFQYSPQHKSCSLMDFLGAVDVSALFLGDTFLTDFGHLLLLFL